MRSWPLLLLSLALFACSHGPGPDEVTRSFLDELIAGQRAEAWALLSEPDQQAMTLEEFSKRRVAADPSPSSTFDAHTTYRIDTWERSGEVATVTVEVTGPDAKEIVGGLMGAIVNTAMSSTGEALPEDVARVERLESGDLPLSTHPRDYHLVREEAGWRMKLDLARELEVEALTREARRIEREGTRAEAIEAWKAVLAVDPDDGIAKRKIEGLEARRERSVPAP